MVLVAGLLDLKILTDGFLTHGRWHAHGVILFESTTPLGAFPEFRSGVIIYESMRRKIDANCDCLKSSFRILFSPNDATNDASPPPHNGRGADYGSWIVGDVQTQGATR